MPTIAGIVNLEDKALVPAELVRSMLEAMQPSLPEDVHVESIAMSRAVIGRTRPRSSRTPQHQQPPVDREARVFCVGEIYDEGTSGLQTPEELLTNRYLQNNIRDFANGLNGSFAAAIACPSHGSVTLVTDHTASQAIFTTVFEGRLYFASEVKGLLAVNDLPVEPDGVSLLSFLCNGFYCNRRSLVKGVCQMDYATVCHIKDGRVCTWPYWRYRIEPQHTKGWPEQVQAFSEILSRSVERRIHGGKCGILLSGGVDSRGVLCCAKQPDRLTAVTYTIRTRETRHELGDWAVAERVARMMGMDFKVFKINDAAFMSALRESVYASEGAADFIFENIWDEIKARTGVDYLLIGDECMGWTNGPVRKDQVLSAIGIKSISQSPKVLDILGRGTQTSLVPEYEEEIERIRRRGSAEKSNDRVDEMYFDQRLIHYLNPKRRVISRSGMGVRNPWVDLDVLTFISKTPTRYRVGKTLFRKALAFSRPDLFHIPRAREGETVSYRWHMCEQENDGQTISETIFNGNPWSAELLNEQTVRKLVARFCSLPTHTSRTRTGGLFMLLPTGARIKLGSLYRYFKTPIAVLSDETLLLRIITVAVTLGYLKERYRKRS